MRVTFNSNEKIKTVNVPDAEIEKLMSKYKISREEAIYTWLVDEDYVTDPTVEELEKKAKANKVSREARKMEKTERKAREKKVNELKKTIIAGIYDYFLDEIGHIFDKNTEITVRNDEKYIDLTIEDRHFTINLVEHRKRESD